MCNSQNCDFKVIILMDMIFNHIHHTNHTKIIVQTGNCGSGPAMTAENEKQAAVVSLPVFLLKKIRANP